MGLCACLWAVSVQGATVTTLSNLTVMGGQDFFDGAASSVTGNADALVTPVVKFSDRWSLFPTYHGYYQGTQEVRSLAGGGTLFEDATGHSILLKSVHTWGVWKIKPSAGLSFEWLRETKDEEWGQGLFDDRKWNVGLETERVWGETSGFRAAYDFYRIDFPNYKSLESAQDDTFSRELAGENVLDNTNHMGTLTLWAPLGLGFRMDLTGVLNTRSYQDQPVVDQQGQLEPDMRWDDSARIDAALSRAFYGPREWRLQGDVGVTFEKQNSNQNHYDVKKAQFQPDYYDYRDWGVAPALTAISPQGQWRGTVEGSFEWRDYGVRPSQDGSGNDLTEPLEVDTAIARFSLVRALSPHASLRFQGSLGWSHSNTDYEQVFQYNYRMANYGIGFSYEY
ncbi:MAG: hypothetical protein IPN90_06560 [Elusimicrobia bacterium]|nr:hypothetical protein [Elusimicrobiota bacterium]